ncbi:hypothetical protein ABIQ69_17070 [Agromyces sp. G08B096]|uniref:DUF304 domain-containing protein n=1 Tax=Agromyces sp. G08B096 TaxID=3156399 RepID=A0AAU7W754_9MICO
MPTSSGDRLGGAHLDGAAARTTAGADARPTARQQRLAARDAAVYAWRARPGEPAVLERLGHSPWLAQFLVHLFALVMMLVVAASWLVPAVAVGIALGWATTMEGGPARAVGLTGPAWMYGLFGLAFLAIAISGIPYVASQTRKDRRPAAILALSPEHVLVETVRAVPLGGRSAETRRRVAPAHLRWHDIRAVARSSDAADERPELLVRRSAVEHLGVPLDGAGDEVAIRIRGDRRDLPVLAHFLRERDERRRLGSAESLRVAQRLSAAT